MDIEWDYVNGWVDILMKTFVEKTLAKLLHTPPKRQQYAPHQWIQKKKTYGKTKQFATLPDTSPVLDKADITYIQKVVGSFIYYSRAVDKNCNNCIK